ncbi:MAG TPA: carboxypeptidase regulatory-like domain-containing protein, partial [Pyrinomonadaceae bacterium]
MLTSLSSSVMAQAGRRPQLVDRSPRGGSAPQQPSPPSPRGQSTVSGRVVYEGTGQPVKQARVHIAPTEVDSFPPFRAPTVLTNARGEFRFDNLPAGKYQITVSDRGGSSPNAMAVTLPVPGLTGDLDPDAETLDENNRAAASVSVDGTNGAVVEIKIPRDGGITGRVLKSNGEPAAGAQVNFVRRRESGGRVTAVFRRSVLTNSQGAYGISLPAGTYVVSATGPVNTKGAVTFPANSLAVTFYPSAAGPRSATPVKVESGGEATGVDITLVARPPHKVSGTVTAGRDGQPLEGLSVSITPDDGSGMSLGAEVEGRTTRTDAQGRWTLKDVPDGEYVLVVGPAVLRGGPQQGRPPFGPGRTIPVGPSA